MREPQAREAARGSGQRAEKGRAAGSGQSSGGEISQAGRGCRRAAWRRAERVAVAERGEV